MNIATSLLGLFVSLLAAVFPTLIYAGILHWFDRYEKEPFRLIVLAFLWGAIPATALSLVVEILLDAPLAALGTTSAEFVSSTAVAPFVEEAIKGLALLGLFLFRRCEFDNVLDGIIYGALVGLGFAMAENFIYFTSAFHEGGYSQLTFVILMRSFVFGLNHALYTSVTGAGLGYVRIARSRWRRWGIPLMAFGASVGLHIFHNFFATLAEQHLIGLLIGFAGDWAAILVVFFVIALAWREEKKWIAEELRSEVELGTLSAEEYAMTISYRNRLRAQLGALLSNSLRHARALSRLSQLATELAFKKHQVWIHGPSSPESRLIEELRVRIKEHRRNATV